MRRSGNAIRAGLILIAPTMALLMLAACAPFGVAPQTPSSALVTATAAANATVQAGGLAGASATPTAQLPALTADPGWVAVARVADGSALGGPSVMGGQAGGATASATLTLGAFKVSSAAEVVVIFGCVSPANIHATLQIDVDVAADSVQCSPTGAPMNRSQYGLTASDIGRTLTVTVTITTDGQPPQWVALVEQPK